jgi:hypothetical protein
MDTIVEQDVLNKLKAGDVVVTKQEQRVRLLSYLGGDSWYCCVDGSPAHDGILFNDQILYVVRENNG